MWIDRDITAYLIEDKTSFAQIIVGPRQCGKSSLLSFTSGKNFKEVTMDDLQIRTLANNDPALFFSQYTPPLIIDEAQYAPNIFPEIKKIIDAKKKLRLFSGANNKLEPTAKPLFRLTGSNEILLDKSSKESLAGRASYYYLNTLSVHEILNAFPNEPITNIMFSGGWPELYTDRNISAIRYLNDYIRTYIEKDIVLSAGIQKQREFNTILSLLAARTGEFLNCSALANQGGIKSVTVMEWVSILERTQLLYVLQAYSSNLNKRLIKAPKIYFLDTGLAVRLQGWQEVQPLIHSPQAEHVFETLVLNEIIKCKNNFARDWEVFVWRTKEGEEIDFVLQNAQGDILAIDAKMGIQSVAPMAIPSSFAKQFPKATLILVSFGGQELQLSQRCRQIPIVKLTDFLLQF